MADLSFKYTKKTVRDIYLSNDIGRESPFDPFKDRTVTRFMTRPDVFTSDGMYFAEKKGRRIPCGVNYNVIPHQANIRVEKLVEEGGIPATRKEDEALHDKGYVRPNYIRDVSFTKAQRFDNEAPLNHVQLKKKKLDERDELIRQENFKKSMLKKGMLAPQEEHSEEDKSGEAPEDPKNATSRVRRKLAEIAPPDFSRAPTFGAPPPKEDVSLLKKGQSKFTLFDFEKKKQPPRSESAPLIAPSRSQKQHEEDESGEKEDDESRSLRETAEQSRKMASAADAQEAWEAKRKETLAKHGLITGNRKELLRAKAIAKRSDTAQGIADFSLLSSRDAPTPFQPRGKETNDLLYLPNYSQTTREAKRLADVRLDKYAGRVTKTTELKDSVDKILTIENLSRFYKNQMDTAKHSVFITPDQQAMYASAMRSSTNSEVSPARAPSKEGPVASMQGLDPLGPIKPFSPFDDYGLHPPTPPKGTMTRKFTKTPDLANFADRSGETIASILCGDRQRRERLAKQALRKEGLL